MYAGQLDEGQSYGELCPAITICFLTKPLFSAVPSGLLRFSLYDPRNRVQFGDQLQVHLIEMSKYNIAEETLCQADWLERWVYFLTESDQREPDELRRLLPAAPFLKATGVLEMIARTPDLRRRYDDRAKAELDRYSFEKDARRGAHAEGLAEGESRGVMKGRVQVLGQLLQVEPTDDPMFDAMTLDELAKLAADLQRQFERRN